MSMIRLLHKKRVKGKRKKHSFVVSIKRDRYFLYKRESVQHTSCIVETGKFVLFSFWKVS